MPVALTIQLPDAIAQRVLDAVAAANGYQAVSADGTPNPTTKRQFVVGVLKEVLRSTVVSTEIAKAAALARDAASDKALAEIKL